MIIFTPFLDTILHSQRKGTNVEERSLTKISLPYLLLAIARRCLALTVAT